jgi:hypothetical protein
MADDPSAEARQAAVREAGRRASELRAHSAELVELSRELRARVTELKDRLRSPPAPGRPRSDGSLGGED